LAPGLIYQQYSTLVIEGSENAAWSGGSTILVHGLLVQETQDMQVHLDVGKCLGY
jgi:hypothetical protein